MTSPNAAGCAAHLNQLQQHECYYYAHGCDRSSEDPSVADESSITGSIAKTCTVIENGRVVVKQVKA